MGSVLRIVTLRAPEAVLVVQGYNAPIRRIVYALPDTSSCLRHSVELGASGLILSYRPSLSLVPDIIFALRSATRRLVGRSLARRLTSSLKWLGGSLRVQRGSPLKPLRVTNAEPSNACAHNLRRLFLLKAGLYCP